MDAPGTKSETRPLDPASTKNLRGLNTRWQPGQSGNPEGRRAELRKAEALVLPETHESIEERRLTATLASRVDRVHLAGLLLSLCDGKEGPEGWPPNLAAIKYVYDRIEGLPVQRHEAKLQSEVDKTALILAERYGLSVEEVQARARAIAQGT